MATETLNLEILKRTAIDHFEITTINTCINLIQAGKIDDVQTAVNWHLENDKNHLNQMFFNQIKKAIN